jgi:hypothetical protein
MKTLIMIGILLTVLAGTSYAQNPVYIGPTGFNITVNEEDNVNNITKISKFATRFDGTITVDFLNSGDPSERLPNISMEGTAGDGTSINIFCSWQDTGVASAEGDNSKKTVTDKFYLVACCSFTAVSDIEESGIAFLNLSGTITRAKGTTGFPQSIKITGSKINGGAVGFVFSGTFSSTLTQQQ